LKNHIELQLSFSQTRRLDDNTRITKNA